MQRKRNLLRFLLDRAAFPLLIFLSRPASEKIRLTPVDDERIYACLKHSKGTVLDIGCGDCRFVDSYGKAYGIDMFLTHSRSFILADALKIPFKDNSFNTVTFIASLNHVVERGIALKEAARVLKDDGAVLITMINPALGFLAHRIFRRRCDPDQIKRIHKKGEAFGLSQRQIKELLCFAGLKLSAKKSILFFGNKLYICKKA